MILADKIINERKKNGWSQEELAEQLSVSRQSVSKWEGAQAVPDIQKIIKMAELFGVTTDYLLKDDLGETDKEAYRNLSESYETTREVRNVSLEEASTFIKLIKEQTPMFANAVSMCILSPVLLIFLAGLSEDKQFGISENVASAFGLVALFVLVTTAVYFFVTMGIALKPYEYLQKEAFEIEYGVAGMVKERKDAFQAIYTSKLAIGIILCIMSAVPLVVVGVLEAKDTYVVAMVCVCLIMVSIGVNLIIRVSRVWQSYEQLLQENDFTTSSKKANGIVESIGGVYWSVVTALYLAISFITGRWDISWIVWPIAGVTFGAISVFAKTYVSSKEE